MAVLCSRTGLKAHSRIRGVGLHFNNAVIEFRTDMPATAASCTAECVTRSWRTRKGTADVVSPIGRILLVVLSTYVGSYRPDEVTSLSLCWQLPAAAASGNASVSLVLSDHIQCDVGICKQKRVLL